MRRRQVSSGSRAQGWAAPLLSPGSGAKWGCATLPRSYRSGLFREEGSPRFSLSKRRDSGCFLCFAGSFSKHRVGQKSVYSGECAKHRVYACVSIY